jgi:hypothetical protein
MSPDPTAQIAALGIEPTYSAREAAAMCRRQLNTDHCAATEK